MKNARLKKTLAPNFFTNLLAFNVLLRYILHGRLLLKICVSKQFW